jgi:putative tryptophan/tyrosine transport system substrate-binding protein
MGALQGRRRFMFGVIASMAVGAMAQTPGRTYVVGYWGSWDGRPPDPATMKEPPRIAWFEDELAKHGFVAGKNTRIEYVFTWDGARQMIPVRAKELLARRPEVILVRGVGIFSGRKLMALQALARSVPVVFENYAEEDAARVVGGDPRRPSGNVTGVALKYAEFAEKRLDLFRQLLPKARRIAVISDYPHRESDLARLEETARRMGLEIVRGDVASHGGGSEATPDAGNAALDATLKDILKARPAAFMAFGGFNAPNRMEQFLDFELKHRIPYIDDGGTYRSVVGFGMDYEDHRRRAVAVIAKVLEGTRPADIPVDSTSRFLLTVNLKRAREIGVEIPPSILVRADRIDQ